MQHHFEFSELIIDQATQKKQIVVVHASKQALIDTESRTVIVSGDDEGHMEMKKAIEELIHNLEEVHAPVDLTKHCCC